MSDYPKMLYFGDARTAFEAKDADHEARLRAAMEPEPTPKPKPEPVTPSSHQRKSR